jgi:hypothetical protein
MKQGVSICPRGVVKIPKRAEEWLCVLITSKEITVFDEKGAKKEFYG